MSKLIAIPFFIDGPRSITTAALTFNNADHSGKLFSERKGLAPYIKSIIGHDFKFSMLKEREGFMVQTQEIEQDDVLKSFRIHIKIENKGCGRKVNAALLLLCGEFLMRPVRLVSFYPASADRPTYLNIEIGYNKLPQFAREDLGISIKKG